MHVLVSVRISTSWCLCVCVYIYVRVPVTVIVWMLLALMPKIYSSTCMVNTQKILKQLKHFYWLHNKPKDFFYISC